LTQAFAGVDGFEKQFIDLFFRQSSLRVGVEITKQVPMPNRSLSFVIALGITYNKSRTRSFRFSINTALIVNVVVSLHVELKFDGVAHCIDL
jgi:hypothetical protein